MFVELPFCLCSSSVLRAFTVRFLELIVRFLSVLQAFTLRTLFVQRPFCVSICVQMK